MADSLQEDIVLAKINIIQNCLSSIDRAVDGDSERIQDFMVENVVVLNLQRACQASIDIAQIVIAQHNLGLPNSYKNAFKILANRNVITLETANKMGKMAGFRNLSVHDYTTINIEILKSIVREHLGDFKEFYGQVLVFSKNLADI
jgi:uncharacterized protein YutE (UPF0331/DUF86 family)